MHIRAKKVGIAVLVLTALAVIFAIWFNHELDQKRSQSIAQYSSLPQNAGCKYDESTCPQSDNTVVPHSVAIGFVILLTILGLYIIRNEATQHRILRKIEEKQHIQGKEERRSMMLSMLSAEERKVLMAIIDQPGISQSTLRLRTQTSKAKLSMLLKDLEQRQLIIKEAVGKINKIHLKREL